MKKSFVSGIFAFIMTASGCLASQAAEPAGYYDDCIGKCGKELLAALCDIIGPHDAVSYKGLWSVYKTSDVYPEDGKVWDMYTTKHWSFGSEQCGNVGSSIGVCYNREHSFPKSWFNDASPMYSDAYHIYPTDGKVNGQRSNYPFGECAGGTVLPSSGGYKALGRLGRSTYPGYSGTVFEPDDMYKGDFARTYFYMAACYNDRISGWNSDMLAHNSYPAFASWAESMLLEWHRKDPVSEKEINRNEAVNKHQNNRNPFIDHPELAEHIWGKKKTEPWKGTAVSEPEISLPADGSVLDLGSAGKGVKKSLTIAVKGSDLSAAVAVAVSGSGFSADKTSIPASSVNSTSGATLTVSYSGTATGQHNGTLTLTSGSAKASVSLRVNVTDGIPVDPATSISESGFVAHWTYVGGDTDGYYSLELTKAADNSSVAGYPVRVNARAELAAVNGLEPDTEYSYTIVSSSARSQTLRVRTAVPQPSIYFYSEEDFTFVAAPGEISEPQEISVEIENIATDVNISVRSPFEVSADRTNWSRSIAIPADADRFYMRFAPTEAGEFTTSIIATAGDFYNDDAEVSGTATAVTAYLEDFEAESENTSYTTRTITGTMGEWDIVKCGVVSESGSLYIRMAKNASDNTSITMRHDKAGGIGTVTVEAAAWSGDETGSIRLDYSCDHGLTWQEAGSADITSTTRSNLTFTVNNTAATRIRIVRTSGGRHKIDNIAISDHRTSGIPGIDSSYSLWDTYCLHGRLMLLNESQESIEARVYGVDGILYASPSVAPGTVAVDLPAGLYIVAVGDFTRRVVVR